MGKPSAPDTISLYMPEPTGRDDRGSPFWRVGPVKISVEVIEYGEDAGKHGVFVDSFEALPEGRSIDVLSVIAAAYVEVQAANARAERFAAMTRAEQVEDIAHNETPEALNEAMESAFTSGDHTSVSLFYDALVWQAENAGQEATA